MKIKNIPYCFALILGLLTLYSCNEEVISRLREDYPNANEPLKSRYNKVIYINIENLPGEVVKDLTENNKLPQLTALLRKSIYSFNSIAEAQEGNEFTSENGLTNLMTGVMSSKHQVLNSYASYDKTKYPSILERFHQKRPQGKTSFHTAKIINATVFSAEKTAVHVSNSDTELETSILKYVETSEDEIVVVNLTSLGDILSNNNMDYSTSAYLEKIIAYDSLIGKLKIALDSRKEASHEEWIIMVSSTNGGKQTGTIATLYDDDSRNIFTMLYNPKFSLKYYPRPSGNVAYADSAIRFIGANSRGRLADATKYNFGAYGNYTVQLLINAGNNATYYPSILSKRGQIFDESSGWTIFMAANNWEFRSANWSFKTGGMIKDGKWHVLTIVFDGTNMQIRLYQDGVLAASGPMNNKNVNNNYPLSIGQIGTDYNTANSEYLLNNIQIYEKAFSDLEVQSVYCQTDITSTHPFYSSLIGYWKANEFGKNVLQESLGTGNNFIMSGPFVWNTFNEISENLCPPVNASYYSSVLNSVDLPFMMFSWLGIPIERDWNWDGRALPLPYDVLTK